MLVAQLVNKTTPIKAENFIGDFSAGQVIDSSFLPASTSSSLPILGVLQSDLIYTDKCKYPIVRVATRGYLAIKIGQAGPGLEVGGLFSLQNGFAVPLRSEFGPASTAGGGNLIIDAIVYGHILTFINSVGAPISPVTAQIRHFFAGIETAPVGFSFFLNEKESVVAQIPYNLNEKAAAQVNIPLITYDGGAATVEFIYLLIEQESVIVNTPYLLIEPEFANVSLQYFLNESEYTIALLEFLLIEVEKATAIIPGFINENENVTIMLPYYLNGTEYVNVGYQFFEAERDLRSVIIQESIALYTSNFTRHFALSPSNNFVVVN